MEADTAIALTLFAPVLTWLLYELGRWVHFAFER